MLCNDEACQSDSGNDNAVAVPPAETAKPGHSFMRHPGRLWMLGLIVAVVVTPICLVAMNAAHRAGNRRTHKGRPGAWGNLEYTRIAIEPPDEYLEANVDPVFDKGQWVFKEMTKAQVEKLFGEADLAAEQREHLMRSCEWKVEPGGVTVFPDRDLVLGMNPKARKAIYTILAQFEENPLQAGPFDFRAEFIDERLENSGLSKQTVQGLKRLLYSHGSVLLFADATPYMTTIADREERRRLFRTISRRATLLVKLHVDSHSDLNQIYSYWDCEGRHKDLRLLLESLARVPGGCDIDLAHLLPPFARKRIYTFPVPIDSRDAMRNCHWSAFNFFNDPPDDALCDPQRIQQIALGECDIVTTAERQMGDILVITDMYGDTIHSCVYVADDIVFTKNGSSNSQPWVYMHLRDMVDTYAYLDTPEHPLQMAIFRHRSSKTISQHPIP